MRQPARRDSNLPPAEDLWQTLFVCMHAKAPFGCYLERELSLGSGPRVLDLGPLLTGVPLLTLAYSLDTQDHGQSSPSPPA